MSRQDLIQKQYEERLYSKRNNKQDFAMEIIHYNRVRDIDVLFENGEVVKNRLY